MRRYLIHGLVLLVAALCGGLAWQWFTPQGQLRRVHWQAPQAKQVDFDSLLPQATTSQPLDTARFVSMLDRPLFSFTRRPPPPPPPPPPTVVAPAVDVLTGARLLAVYSGGGAGGAVVSIAGKSRRLRLTQGLEGWVLTAVGERTATFVNAGQTRQLQLVRSSLTTGAVALPQDAAAEAPSGDAPAPPPLRSRPRGAVFGGS